MDVLNIKKINPSWVDFADSYHLNIFYCLQLYTAQEIGSDVTDAIEMINIRYNKLAIQIEKVNLAGAREGQF